MCLAIPAKIISVSGNEAVAEIQGVSRNIIVSLIHEPRAGDYVLIHAGFAIRKWSEEDMREFNAIVSGEGIINNGPETG
jgi:hydrogenase expression/formation protein HypC